jgi:hypothetical protein
MLRQLLLQLTSPPRVVTGRASLIERARPLAPHP